MTDETEVTGFGGWYSLPVACALLGIKYDAGFKRIRRGVPHVRLSKMYLVKLDDLRLAGRSKRPA